MKDSRTIPRWAAWCLVLALVVCLLPTAAPAELRRGSKGEEVRELQTMLSEMGFLEDRVDGDYGKKTEAAVKRFQAFAGLKQTGRLDSKTQLTLTDCYFIATGVMSGDGADPEELGEDLPDSCRWTTEIDGEGAALCARHLDVKYLWDWYFRPDKPEKLERLLSGQLIAQWTWYIDAMYDQWEENLPEDRQHIALDEKEAFYKALDDDAAWAESDTKQNPLGGLQAKVVWIEARGIDLCQALYGPEGEIPPEEDGEE